MHEPLGLFIHHIFPQFTMDWSLVEPHLETRSLKKGDFLIHEGDPCNLVGLTLHGCLRMFFLKDGKELTLFFCPEGYPLGDYQNLRLQRPAIFSCQAIEDSDVLILNRQVLTVLESASEGPQLMRQVVEFLAFRLRDRLLSLYRDTPEQRYLALMEAEPHLLQRVPQHYIASYLGLEPESLSRLKRRLYQGQLSKQSKP
ncbi:Crp/Fnr family transcriptional regulator [Phormidium tenue]|uniref:cAMP-binding protein n=1 Tax=Phormidium tenue NIES-30 TaxID=549789 RepID=A0A1U7J2E4_9CYAN|nr:Crp/Fnr family transcriptional regulator [Phormidium tenue]MBD2231721.1 Crp/Fnr family transcriptional regulator [Phormidium tenue FACHB-1052]OKH46299.1 cAMP-binding protein [Phormidium tenue NIES-30]